MLLTLTIAIRITAAGPIAWTAPWHGLPLAIEQDLFWYTDKVRGQSWSIVTHGTPADGSEPTLREYFLERIRPLWNRR